MDVRGKRVLVVGLGRSGREAARCLSARGATVTVTDSRPPSAFKEEISALTSLKVGMELGQHREETFLLQDLIVVSPGVPWDMPHLANARERGIQVVPEVEAASWFLKGPIIGITGSNGKTTTTALLGRILKASGFSTFVGGNIGVALISAVDRTTPETMLVTELSSFQLEAIQSFRPHVAVLLNLTPNHLDRHPNFEAYVKAKAQIFRNQTQDDWAVLNADDPAVMNLAPTIPSRKVLFSRRRTLPDGMFTSNGRVRYRVSNLEKAILETSDVTLRGAFNVENVLAAAAAACLMGADFNALREAVREFPGVEHRLEFVRAFHGVEFYNDSKATSVDATAKALSAFEKGVHLILGGKDKGAPYAPLRPLMKDRVREVLLIGAAADRIERELKGSVEMVRAGDLDTAVHTAFQHADSGDVVLLAPACSSYDQFEDFEHRGRVFKKIVSELSRAVTAEGGVELIQVPAVPSFASLAPSRAAESQDELPDTQVTEEQIEDTTEAATPPADPEVPIAALATPAEPLTKPRELIYFYDVGADEFPPSEAGPAEQDVDAADSEELRPLEISDDNILPFEVTASTARASGEKRSQSGAEAEPSGPGEPKD
jgi:UDP-N-acetylmuramoylalanine--D-glutamate ligase